MTDFLGGNTRRGDPRHQEIPPRLIVLLADRERQARAHRRHLHATLWPSVLVAFAAGFFLGVVWSA